MTALLAQLLVEYASIDPQHCTGGAFDATCEQVRRELREATLQSLAQRVQRDPAALTLIAAHVAVPESWFFRYPASFEALRDACLARGRAPRMASIGCAGGQEAFSMAATALAALGADADVTVDAVDRNPAAIEVARAGSWSGLQRTRGAFPSWAAPWVREHAGRIELHERTRAAVRFSTVDGLDALLALLDGASFDAIFCRNMLIYLHEGARARLVDALTRAVPAGGLLFLGHAEAGLGAPNWQRSSVPESFAYRRCDLPPLVPRNAPRSAATKPSAGEGAWARRPPVPRTGPAAPQPAQRPTAQGPAGGGSVGAGGDATDGVLCAHVDSLMRSAEERLAAGDAREAARILGEVVFLAPQHDLAMLALADLHDAGGRHLAAQHLRARARSIALREAHG